MKNLLTILVFAFGYCLYGYSQETLRLEALAPEGKLVNGREYIPLSNGQISVELGYDCKLGENLLFDLVIINETDHPISLNPLAFFYLELDDPEGDSSRFPPRMAVAPLNPYKWYDRALEVPKHETFFSPFIEIPAMFMEGFFGSWTTLPSDNTLEKQEWVNRMKDVIRQDMMQEMELAPGGAANGFVWFPGPPGTKYLLFCLPLDDQEFQFAYKLKNASRH
jgi:hypothetical protein